MRRGRPVAPPAAGAETSAIQLPQESQPVNRAVASQADDAVADRMTAVVRRAVSTYDYNIINSLGIAVMAGQNFSIRTDAATLDELDRLAKARDRSRNFVVNEAIERYLSEERAWAEKVRAGLAAAESGDFASDAEVDALFGRFEASERKAGP